MQVYSPLGPLGLLLPRRWRRLHRKLCVVDGCVLYCGGINVLDDLHDPNHGALESPRFDFAVRVEGRLVEEAGEAMEQVWWRLQATRDARQHRLADLMRDLRAAAQARQAERRAREAASDGLRRRTGLRAGLLLRDNLRNRSRIERAYRRAIGNARHEVIIANAYFLPGRKLRHALVLAARRGVRVRLLLQGRYEYFMQYHAARPVYGALLAAGVEIHEYAPSFLHAKVAVIDAQESAPGRPWVRPTSIRCPCCWRARRTWWWRTQDSPGCCGSGWWTPWSTPAGGWTRRPAGRAPGASGCATGWRSRSCASLCG